MTETRSGRFEADEEPLQGMRDGFTTRRLGGFSMFAADGGPLSGIDRRSGDGLALHPLPAGGAALLRSHTESDGTRSTFLTRYDSGWTAMVSNAPLETGGAQVDAAIDLQGNVLLTRAPVAPSVNVEARWFSLSGMPLTAWFDTGMSSIASRQTVYEGIALWPDASGRARVVPDAQQRIVDGPSWLAGRSRDRLQPVHGGAGYAFFPPGGAAVTEVEVLSKSGKRCGSIRIPGEAIGAGPDGSVIASENTRDLSSAPPPQQAGPNNVCTFHIYNALFR
jgi:hypothetical protein